MIWRQQRDKALAAVPDYNLMSEEKTDLLNCFNDVNKFSEAAE